MLVPFRQIPEGRGALFSTFLGEIRIMSVLFYFTVTYCLSSSPSSQKYNTGWIERYPEAAKCVLTCRVGCHQRSYGETGSDNVQCPRVVEYRAQKE